MNDKRLRDAFEAIPDDPDAPARAVAALAGRRADARAGRAGLAPREWAVGAGLATACLALGYASAGLGRAPASPDALLAGEGVWLLLGFV